MFSIEMTDEEKREVLLDMSQHQIEAAIRKGTVAEEDVIRLLPSMFGLLPDFYSIAKIANIRSTPDPILSTDDDGDFLSMFN